MSKPMSAKRRAAVRRRRTLLTLLALVAIAAVVLLVWRPWEPGGSTPPATAPAGTAPASPDPASTDPAATPTPTPTGPFTPIGGEPSTAPTEPCAPAAIRISPVTDHTTYAADERVQLSFTIENIGESACSLNAGTAVQEYEIRTGDQVVYRWSDCAADVQDNVVQLEPATPQSTVPIEWDRTRSSVETCTAERPQVTAGGAAYNLSVRVGDYASTESRQFILE